MKKTKVATTSILSTEVSTLIGIIVISAVAVLATLGMLSA